LELLVFPAKSLDSSSRVNQLLFPGIERVAFGADFNPDFLFRGTSGDFISAGAFNDCFMILGMDIFLHRRASSLIDLIPEFYIIHQRWNFSILFRLAAGSIQIDVRIVPGKETSRGEQRS